jgi:hypothetical protein
LDTLNQLCRIVDDMLSRQIRNMMSDHVGVSRDGASWISFDDVEDLVGLSLGQTVVQLDVEILKKLDWLNDGASSHRLKQFVDVDILKPWCDLSANLFGDLLQLVSVDDGGSFHTRNNRSTDRLNVVDGSRCDWNSAEDSEWS